MSMIYTSYRFLNEAIRQSMEELINLMIYTVKIRLHQTRDATNEENNDITIIIRTNFESLISFIFTHPLLKTYY